MPALVLHVNLKNYLATKPRLALRKGKLITSCHEHYFSYVRILRSCGLRFSFHGVTCDSYGPLDFFSAGTWSWSDPTIVERTMAHAEYPDPPVPISFPQHWNPNPLAQSGTAFLFPGTSGFPNLGAYFSPTKIAADDPDVVAYEMNHGYLGSNGPSIDEPAPADFEIRYSFEVLDDYFYDGTYSRGAAITLTRKFSYKQDVYYHRWVVVVSDASFTVKPLAGSSAIPSSLKDFEITWSDYRQDMSSSYARMNGVY